MDEKLLQQLRYPVGKFIAPTEYKPEELAVWIKTIEEFPAKVASLTKDLTHEQLNWRYRPAGWTIKQVVHHCSDSHLNSIIRFKWALTEDAPTIKPYMENLWAELPDSLHDDISDSLTLLNALHRKWVRLLRSLNKEQWMCTFVHPQHGKIFRLDATAAMYAWHCRHHTAHIEQALKYEGKF